MDHKWKDAFKLLRVQFSYLLLPIFLFALSQSETFEISDAIWVFIILHLFIYPASNAYNSWNDKDTGSIGGLKQPPPVNRRVILLANILDLSALILGFICIGPWFGLLLIPYIGASRIYSWRRIRLKKYPISGYLLVIIFQGGYTYMLIKYGLEGEILGDAQLWAAIAASLQIGAMYPLTQIYQHDDDQADGVRTISMLLGKVNTFYFSGLMFAVATAAYWMYFSSSVFLLLLLFQIPIVAYFIYWFLKVRRDPQHASFTYTGKFTLISATCLNLFYLTLVIFRL